jgi:hypothetical protein
MPDSINPTKWHWKTEVGCALCEYFIRSEPEDTIELADFENVIVQCHLGGTEMMTKAGFDEDRKFCHTRGKIIRQRRYHGQSIKPR